MGILGNVVVFVAEADCCPLEEWRSQGNRLAGPLPAPGMAILAGSREALQSRKRGHLDGIRLIELSPHWRSASHTHRGMSSTRVNPLAQENENP